MSMPLARINDRILHFVHVPKTGGSSINRYLRAKGSMVLYSREPVDWMRISPQHMHRRANMRVLSPGFADAAFLILRDPVARMVSEYRYRAARRAEATGTEQGPVVEWHDGSGFEADFDTWASAVLDLAAADPFLYDNHIRPQSDFWQPGLTVFFFEEGLTPVLDWIDRVTRTPRILSHVHENPGARIPVAMSDATRDRIESFYRDDIAFIARMKKARAAGAAPGPERMGAPDVRRAMPSAK